MSQTCQYRLSPNQLLVAHTGSAIGLDHSRDVLVVCKISSNAHDHVGRNKVPGVRNQVVAGQSWDAPDALRGDVQGMWRACMPPTLLCKLLLSYIINRPVTPGRTYTWNCACTAINLRIFNLNLVQETAAVNVGRGPQKFRVFPAKTALTTYCRGDYLHRTGKKIS
eukprot:6207261-Pleurochrysis_carterae.AAC.1